MHDPLDFERRPLISRLTRKRRIAATVLFAEKAGKSLWRIFSWLAFFAGLWLLTIPDIIGDFGPPLCLIIFVVGLVYLLRRDLPTLRWPDTDEIDRRLEQSSNLEHRPLSVIEDILVNPKKEDTRKLWERNKDSAFETLGKLRLPLPRAILPQNDPVALRSFAALILIVGLVAAGPQWQERMKYGIFPFDFMQKEQKASPITLWITPPEYTGLPQITMTGSGKNEEKVKIPEDSIVKVRVSKGIIQPRLMMGELEIALESLGDESWGLETTIVTGERLQLKQWFMTRADIAYEYVIDKPPQLTLTGEPEILTDAEIRIPLTALDDYSVTEMTMHMDLDPMIKDKPLGTSFEETRAVMSPPAMELEIAPVYDLAWHPWAGLPVVITIEGVDHVGQKGTIPPIKMTLPERSFNHPVAKELIEMRKRLIWTPEAAAANVAFDLGELLKQPEQFQYDPIVLLALRSASGRLTFDKRIESMARVVELLWDTALHIEEGDLPLAARNLRDAQRNLEMTLGNPDATKEEIAQALEEFRQAMAEYFQELYREMQKRMAENGQQMQIPPEMFQNLMNPEDIASFLDQLQAEALSGDRDAARELLSQMQQFMDMLDPSTNMGMPPQMQFMMEGVSELQQLIEKQQALLDQTQQQSDRLTGKKQQYYPEFVPFDNEMLEQWDMGEMPPPPSPEEGKEMVQVDTSENKVEQDALRYILGQLMLEADEQLGEIPENMGEAEQEMRDSATQLGDNRPDLSVPHQEKAIEHLQQAMQDMSKQMQQMMKNMMMFSMGMGQMDPLGRQRQDGNNSGMFPGSRVKIPDEAERKRVQEILKTLRQRSGEINRPDYELEYYRRLMKQF